MGTRRALIVAAVLLVGLPVRVDVAGPDAVVPDGAEI